MPSLAYTKDGFRRISMQYPATDKRLFGVSVPLGSIRVKDGWRAGEYPDLVPFARLCSRLGAGLVQILPVNDTGSHSSPYFALSAFALHPLYIRVHDLPEAATVPEALSGLDEFAAKTEPGEHFPYEGCLNAKLAALRLIYHANRKAIASDKQLKAFIADRPWVKIYAVYKRLKASFEERSWLEWPENRDLSLDEIEALWGDRKFADEHLFYAWTQMRASGQFEAAAKAIASMGMALLGDIPILMNEDSADVWAYRSFFDLQRKAGAPPDMYSSMGQNWGFPVYDWDALAAEDYSFWRNRIAEADRYYSAFRIDHVLGFFRLWTLGARDLSGVLGRFEPGALVEYGELAALGFSPDRIKWLAEPHIRGVELREALHAGADGAIAASLDRIGSEDLYLFKQSIHGEADIVALNLEKDVTEFLMTRWRDRALIKVELNTYALAWSHAESRAWATLSGEERFSLESLFSERSAAAELGWEKRGRVLLSMLKESSRMLPCAEDLGAVPDCVPRVLAELGVPGLRVPRWVRYWDKPGQPFKPLAAYEVLTACTPSVHDTSTFRDWWDNEDGRESFAKEYCPTLSPVPARLDPKTALTVLKSLAKAPSILFVAQLQDLLDTSGTLRSSEPASDRINVPGVVDGLNWTWRMRYTVDALESEHSWIDKVQKACTR